MPFDGQNFPKPDPYSLDTFIAWLETMPANGRYKFMGSSSPCLVQQYANALGCSKDYNRLHWSKTGHSSDITVFGKVAAEQPHTFGAALSRAKAARPSTRADIDALLEEARL